MEQEKQQRLTRNKVNLFLAIHTRFSLYDLEPQSDIAITQILRYLEKDKNIKDEVATKATEAIRRKEEWQHMQNSNY